MPQNHDLLQSHIASNVFSKNHILTIVLQYKTQFSEAWALQFICFVKSKDSQYFATIHHFRRLMHNGNFTFRSSVDQHLM